MKKIITFQLIYVFTIICSYAQDWSPINSHEKFNYRLTGANIVSAQIKADSAKLINGDSVYYLNRIAKYCDTCKQTSYIRSNLPQFLQKKVTILNTGFYNFKDSLNIVLHTMAPLNYTWLYDSTKYITAQVAQIKQETIFGVLDSVRVISLSSGDTVIVSKSYGIIRYPYKYGAIDSFYTLTGIEGRNIGEQLSGFKGAFKWNIGDMFEIVWHVSSEDTEDDLTDYKFSVENKYVNGDTIKYGIHVLQSLRKSIGGASTTTTYSYSNYSDTLVFVDSLNHIANNYPNQFCFNKTNSLQFKNYFNNDGGDFYGKPGNASYGGANGISSISVDSKGNEISSDSSNFKYPGQAITLVSATYQEGLGLTYYTNSFIMQSSQWSLIAYRKGNDTVGAFTPDSAFVAPAITAITPAQATNAALVYPNPAKDNITIAFTQPQQGSITLSDVQGQTVKEEKLDGASTTIDISTLSPGMYIISVNTTEGTEYFKVIKQ